jgi:FkbM family methyltransferase
MRWLVDAASTGRRIGADRASWLVYARLSAPWAQRGELRPMRVRDLPQPIVLRPGTTDWTVVRSTFADQHHLPLVGRPTLIWDLGCNIGLTAAHFAVSYPGAQVVALEPDPENAELARRNTAWLGERCTIVEAALWSAEGTVSFSITPGREAGSHVSESGDATVRAVSPPTLIAEFGPPSFVKMDIEGAERELLAAPAAWLSAVQEIRVECHGTYTTADCAHDLEAAGFRTRVIPERMARDSVVGFR